MKVSVIVPVYNVEAYLRKCLDSLVQQSLEELEILVVNDGSPDRSQDIVDEYVKKYPGRVLSFQKENGGQGSARNLALDYAKGEFIGFVDSDDWVDLDMFETMYKQAVETEAKIVICNTVDHFTDHDVYHQLSRLENYKQCGSVCNKLFHRTVIGESRFPTGVWYEDFCFGTKLLMQTQKIAYCEQYFYHVYMREGSTMHNINTKKNLDILRVMDEIVEFVKEKQCMEQLSKELEYIMIEHILLTSINRVAEQMTRERKEVIEQLRKYVLSYYKSFWKDEAFQEFGKSQKIVSILNAYGFWRVSQFLFQCKQILKKS